MQWPLVMRMYHRSCYDIYPKAPGQESKINAQGVPHQRENIEDVYAVRYLLEYLGVFKGCYDNAKFNSIESKLLRKRFQSVLWQRKFDSTASFYSRFDWNIYVPNCLPSLKEHGLSQALQRQPHQPNFSTANRTSAPFPIASAHAFRATLFKPSGPDTTTAVCLS